VIYISREKLEGRTETKRELAVIELVSTLQAQDQIQKGTADLDLATFFNEKTDF